jgi:hypothetical protein
MRSQPAMRAGEDLLQNGAHPMQNLKGQPMPSAQNTGPDIDRIPYILVDRLPERRMRGPLVRPARRRDLGRRQAAREEAQAVHDVRAGARQRMVADGEPHQRLQHQVARVIAVGHGHGDGVAQRCEGVAQPNEFT